MRKPSNKNNDKILWKMFLTLYSIENTKLHRIELHLKFGKTFYRQGTDQNHFNQGAWYKTS